MELKHRDMTLLLGVIALTLITLIIVLPLNLLEILSLEVVGEPPINGRTWLEGVQELSGEISMKVIAVLGVLIIIFIIPFFLKQEKTLFIKREVKGGEIPCFITITSLFFVVNFLIGYTWWDPNAFLGMGSSFLLSMTSLIILGLMPNIIRRIFKFEKQSFAVSTENLKKYALIVVVIAYAYGLISCIWHCCSFYDIKMYFFFFIIKFIQLWSICSFFFKYGFKLFLNKTKPWISYSIISILFGFCYPWHTFGFALTFTLFGFALCLITLRSDSYVPGLILLYFAYIFHAGLPWHGALITFALILPFSIGIVGVLIYLTVTKKEL